MTPSLARMEEGKPAGAGRCCLLTDFPLRQPRRISNLPAGVHSACPNTSSIGPAVFPYIGRRADPLHPGLVSIPGSQSVLEPPVAASLLTDDELCPLILEEVNPQLAHQAKIIKAKKELQELEGK